MSISTGIFLPSSSPAFLVLSITFECHEWLLWLIFVLAISIPAFAALNMSFFSKTEGPRLAMIFVRVINKLLGA